MVLSALLTTLTVYFTVLKLAGIAEMSWWLALLPTEIDIVFFLMATTYAAFSVVSENN